MKKLATLFAMMAVGLGHAWAQGQIDFHNPSSFPVTVKDPSGNVTTMGSASSPLGPATVRVGLFVGANGTPFSGMTMVGMTTNSASSNPLAVGTFFGGNPYIVPGFTTGTTISFAFAAWSISTGSLTYRGAYDPTINPGRLGYASQIPVVGNGYTLAGGAGTPPLTWGDKTLAPPAGQPWMVSGLQLTPVPEPSTIALGILGAAALLLRRRN